MLYRSWTYCKSFFRFAVCIWRRCPWKPMWLLWVAGLGWSIWFAPVRISPFPVCTYRHTQLWAFMWPSNRSNVCYWPHSNWGSLLVRGFCLTRIIENSVRKAASNSGNYVITFVIVGERICRLANRSNCSAVIDNIALRLGSGGSSLVYVRNASDIFGPLQQLHWAQI